MDDILDKLNSHFHIRTLIARFVSSHVAVSVDSMSKLGEDRQSDSTPVTMLSTHDMLLDTPCHRRLPELHHV